MPTSENSIYAKFVNREAEVSVPCAIRVSRGDVVEVDPLFPMLPSVAIYSFSPLYSRWM